MKNHACAQSFRFEDRLQRFERYVDYVNLAVLCLNAFVRTKGVSDAINDPLDHLFAANNGTQVNGSSSLS